ncbi:MAG: adenylyl-sulfate kinase [Ruminococcus sp.]|nr:adenylyl-sulfate kinase [Ruminococcus sp.]
MKYYIEDLNYQIENHAEKFIAYCESEYDKTLCEIALDIAKNCESTPVVLISGPSGSGKTTTALKLEEKLDRMGHESHTISLDNYFRALSEEELKLSKEGKMDLESPDRLDENYLNMQLKCIIEGIAVDIPKYNFVTCQREFSGWTLKRRPGEIIIFEGTHALNPNVIKVPDEKCARIYVSIRSQFHTDDDELRSKVIRLARRMIRDQETRDRNPLDTINMFKSVNEGEDEHIRPFMGRCNYSIDTVIPYELNVYSALLLNTLDCLPKTIEIEQLCRVISQALPLDTSLIPKDSLMREFIGGSSLNY